MHFPTPLQICFAVTLFAVLAPGTPQANAQAHSKHTQCGEASWYKLTGKTASGEAADPNGMTAAHRTLPFGTKVVVTNLSNGRFVTVRINDRGPYAKDRVIDVTMAAAQKLDFINQGVARVKIASDTPIDGINARDFCQ